MQQTALRATANAGAVSWRVYSSTGAFGATRIESCNLTLTFARTKHSQAFFLDINGVLVRGGLPKSRKLAKRYSISSYTEYR
ncbi:MAG TPA: hypothetical protein VMY18_00190 [Acidobacteriota bacterium]|nr:hypothetical protein [Acidobacteriota bacterium]